MRIKAGTLVDVRTSSVDHDTFSDSDEYVVVNPESPESSRPDDTPDSSVASDSKRSKSSKDGGGPPDGPQLNRGVLITCAGGDVGRAIALHFVRRGFRRLYLIDHEPRRHALYETRRLCRDVACSVWSTHPEPRPVFKRIVEAEVVSLTGWSAVEKVVERAREKLQGIWYCVHWPSVRLLHSSQCPGDRPLTQPASSALAVRDLTMSLTYRKKILLGSKQSRA